MISHLNDLIRPYFTIFKKKFLKVKLFFFFFYYVVLPGYLTIDSNVNSIFSHFPALSKKESYHFKHSLVSCQNLILSEDVV